MTTVKTEHPHIVKVRGVRGGRPIISGTRIPVWLIAANWEEGCTSQEILEHYPQLTPAQLYDALSYYYDHPKEIKAQIGEHDLTDVPEIFKYTRGSMSGGGFEIKTPDNKSFKYEYKG